ncbi:hypothetical protein INT45_002955 [Circinella minor]|uniref:ER membrane protein complex subunit 10 n=1 Tax=Circinella minor TaxID=1195481 RepID=A0A8H7SA60_9FUNG|nr:hypothetical protein INT45_002955 [Circinella minor]
MRVSYFFSVLIALSFIGIAIATEVITTTTTTTTTTNDNNNEIKLHVYHKQGADYKKRGEIVGLPQTPSYIATTQDNTIELNSPLYQIKIRDETTDRVILSSVKACQLVNSDWNDEFRIHLDDEKKVYHVDYYAEGDTCESNIELPYKGESKFVSKVFIERPAAGPKPFLGQSGGSKSSQSQTQAKQQGGKEKSEDEMPIEEEKTFFQKYWYLVVGGGLLLVNLMNAPSESSAPRR